MWVPKMADDSAQRKEGKGKRSKKSRDQDQPASSRSQAKRPRDHPPTQDQMSKEEWRRHKAIEKACNKAAAASHIATPKDIGPSPDPGDNSGLTQADLMPPLSPDISVTGESIAPEAGAVFPSEAPTVPQPVLSQAAESGSRGAGALEGQTPQKDKLDITPALAQLIADSIKQGIAQGLQERSLSKVSDYLSRHTPSVRSQPLRASSHSPPRAISPSRAVSPSRVSQTSLSEGDEQPIIDQELSDDEGLEPDQPSFVGLFKPQMFRSLLHKAQVTTGLGIPPTNPQPQPSASTFSSALFELPAVQTEIVPAPKLFLDVLQRQWKNPSTGPIPNSLDRRLYNLAAEYASLLQIPVVDSPVAALASSTPSSGPAEESLRPEERKVERTVIKGHQAAAWASQAASAGSFFTRASIIWLKQLQKRIPASEVRNHQDINKILAAMEFSADATLNSARFSAKAIGSAVTSRRMLWMKYWQADVRNKWRLASSPYE